MILDQLLARLVYLIALLTWKDYGHALFNFWFMMNFCSFDLTLLYDATGP